jgi:hypothetical protein
MMKRTVLTFGAISGALSSLMMFATVPVLHQIGFDKGLVVGYTAIVAALLLVFFGIRSYREHSGGSLTFGRGFAVGILITLISCLCYVLTWEFIYFNMMPDFWTKYTAYAVEHARSSGASPDKLAEMRRQMDQFKMAYDNPLINAAYTFIEPFPVGLVITIVSAAVLRRKAA